MAGKKTIQVDGHSVNLTNLDKILYPTTGTTKGDVLDYYLQVAPLMVPQAAWRPATRKRWVNGVGTEEQPGKFFFRKNLESSAPSWVPTDQIEHQHGTNIYPLVNNAAVLAWFAQVAALEVHVPQWRFDDEGVANPPDRLVFDLDPGPGTGLEECAIVAKAIREILSGANLDPLPVTSGSKGLHLYAALDGSVDSEQASALAHKVAGALETDMPDLVVAMQRKALREGKVLIDWSQNSASKTTICPYSLRGRIRPTVAAPRMWEELDEPNLRQLTYLEVLERAEEGIDPLASQGWYETHAPLPSTRLARYREKRDPTRTPEPVPPIVTPSGLSDDSSANGEQPIFVIQEHHASHLHWDLRLEHGGVLVSWAVPKGPPLDAGQQRLAVQTEDHPLEYATFAGTIPKGEYGGGKVTIWDTGSVAIEKWTEKEIIFVLDGQPEGGLKGQPRRFALINTAGSGEKSQWLLLFTKDQPRNGQPATQPVSSAVDAPSPMLATLADPDELVDEDGWAWEMKWDGVRAICVVEDGKTRIFSRNGNEITHRYPELAELAGSVVADRAILDGEIVALDEEGIPSFAALQSRMHASAARSAELAKETPVTLMLFDILEMKVGDQELDVSAAPYRQRQELLRSAVVPSERVKVSERFTGSLEDALQHAKEGGLEGVVAKRLDSPYVAGVRSEDWVKLKERIDQAVVVIGWRVDEAGHLRSFLVAIPDEHGDLEYVGRVGSGIRPSEISDLEAILESHEQEQPPLDGVPESDRRDARWVEPTLVGEVTYAQRTQGGRLRAPVWRGWRDDLDATAVHWE